MKKLILSIAIMLIAFSGFSQKDTTRVNDSTVKIPIATARLISKDLVLKDYYQDLYKVYYQKDSLNQMRIGIKDSTIKDYQKLDNNNTYMLGVYKNQQQVDKTTITTLNKQLKLEKWGKWGGLTIGIIGGFFIGHNIFK